MIRKRQPASLPTSLVHVNVADPWFQIRGMQTFFGYLSYPPLPLDHKQAAMVVPWRNRFMLDIEAEAFRHYLETGGNIEKVRNVAPAILRRATGIRGKRIIEGAFSQGFHRIGSRRLLAAHAAWPTLAHKGIVPNLWAKTGPGEPPSVDEMLHALLKEELDRKAPLLEADEEDRIIKSPTGEPWRDFVPSARGRVWYNDQFKRFKQRVWYETLPVFPLSLALHSVLLQYKGMLDTPDLPASLKGYLLLKDPNWLTGALAWADTYAPVLHEYIPDFDQATAVQLIPMTPVTAPTFNPTLRFPVIPERY